MFEHSVLGMRRGEEEIRTLLCSVKRTRGLTGENKGNEEEGDKGKVKG